MSTVYGSGSLASITKGLPKLTELFLSTDSVGLLESTEAKSATTTERSAFSVSGLSKTAIGYFVAATCLMAEIESEFP